MYLRNIPKTTITPKCGRAAFKVFSPFRANENKIKTKDGSVINIPPEPTTCCMSGCANCVWIEWAQNVSKLLKGKRADIVETVLEKVDDPQMKAYLSLELRLKVREACKDCDDKSKT